MNMYQACMCVTSHSAEAVDYKGLRPWRESKDQRVEAVAHEQFSHKGLRCLNDDLIAVA